MHHVVVGLTWLKKRLAALGLKRRNVVETRLTLVHQAITNELQTSNCCLGYRAMWRLLQLKYRYTIKRSTVMMLLAVISIVLKERDSNQWTVIVCVRGFQDAFVSILSSNESRNIKDAVVVGVESYQVNNPH
ncbi:hypothetical protein EMCRGX_G021850 [Ephydatia muelleri]